MYVFPVSIDCLLYILYSGHKFLKLKSKNIKKLSKNKITMKSSEKNQPKLQPINQLH